MLQEVTDEAPPLASVDSVVQYLRSRYRDRIVGFRKLAAEDAVWDEFPAELDERLLIALNQKGFKKLYSHQRSAWDAVRSGKHTVVVTPTASGKTLCYNLPVMHEILRSKAKALYLFPTKALSQDQVAEITEINQMGELGIRAFTFDGDTPGDARKAVRTRGDIVVTNPDMLHQGILPHHTKWAQFFENLRYIVIDEMHTYRGVFGSHVANVLRRLMRVAQFYGAKPVYILCSATIANPRELAQKLVGSQDVVAITKSGASRGEKNILIWNPPVVNPDLAIRASARSQSTLIARIGIKAGLKSIVFAQSRLMVEVITKYLKDIYDNDPRRPARIHAYRGGYLPTERRDTEKKMRSGDIDCVVSTSALELGVDIGALDISILNGYPGSIAGSWQRLGRAGRRHRPSLGVLVTSSLPLDQFMAAYPDFFFAGNVENAQIDPDQLLILLDHIRCAAFELPFRTDAEHGGKPVGEFLQYLAEEGVLHREGAHWHWMADAYPANAVSLRSVAEGNFVVVDTTDGRQTIIAEVDYHSAPVTIYEGAIYMVQADPWQVEKLDWVGRKAFVTKTNADYYTDAIDYTKLKILEQFEQQQTPSALACRGEVHLVRRVAGYKKIRYYTHENIGYGKVNLPDSEMHTTSVWWQLSNESLDRLFDRRWQALDGFLGAAYALHTVAAVHLMAEAHDIGRAVGSGDAEWFATVDAKGRGSARSIAGEAIDIDALDRFSPTVFLYDNYPGGIGLSAPLFDARKSIVEHAVRLVEHCQCEVGCPACVGPTLVRGGEYTLSAKEAALCVLKSLSI